MTVITECIQCKMKDMSEYYMIKNVISVPAWLGKGQVAK